MIRSRQDNRYTSYVLEHNSQFYMTGYRILKKQINKGWIPCSKILYNGKIQLLYRTAEYSPVSVGAAQWGAEEVYGYTARILKKIFQVKEHGFLSIEGVDVDLSRIFTDGEKNIYLIILPVHIETAAEGEEWENRLRRSLVSLIELSAEPDGNIQKNLRKKLMEPGCSLERMCREMNPEQPEQSDVNEEESYTLGLRVRKPVEGQMIRIDKQEFLIGKNKMAVDGVLDYLPTISRVHCKVTKRGEKYFIEDMHSVNHTCVNGQRMMPGEQKEIKPGDQIRIAEVELYVVKLEEMRRKKMPEI